ncbi:MAG: hypothetical protein LC798_04405 [Chloroflexi bacterium]|nr:hypothetical protein [Chloroflexota bacterium]
MRWPSSRPLRWRAAFAVLLVAAVGGGALVVSGARDDDGGDARAAERSSHRFPSPATTGVPRGWKPRRTLTQDLHVTRRGAVIADVLLNNADIVVEAPEVTIRRVKLQGGRITNFAGPSCLGDLRIEDTTIAPAPGERYSVESEGVVDTASYSARRVKIWRRSEGFRVAGGGAPGCGATRIRDSFAKIVIPPGRCDLHSDGIQGYGAPPTIIENTTIDFRLAECGTAPVFFPSGQGNTRLTVRRLLVIGGGYPFRMGVPGDVAGLAIASKSWVFGPIDVDCSLVSSWDAKIVSITSGYQVRRVARRQRCDTDGGG